MIFDCDAMALARVKYQDRPDCDVPLLLVLERRVDCDDEKKIMEDILQRAPIHKQKEWLGNLFSGDDTQYISTWFEIMLAAWLMQVGEVQIEPEICGERPDYFVNINGQELVIEAKAWLQSQLERNQIRWLDTLCGELEKIPFPFLVDIIRYHLVHRPDFGNIISKVQTWLIVNPHERLIYEGKQGNKFVFECSRLSDANHVMTGWGSGAKWLNPDEVKPALKKKARDNQAIREAGYPYVIALFIESPLYSPAEVVDAWFGNVVYTYDVESLKIVDQKRNRKGLHFYRNQVLHKSVSGTIAFRAHKTNDFQGRQLQGWYIENPFAHVKLDPEIFPVEGIHRVLNKDGDRFFVGWTKPTGLSTS